MTRAGHALRMGWALDARRAEIERRYPGYLDRRWRAGQLLSQVSQRYGRLLLAHLAPEDALQAAMAMQSEGRLRVEERPGGRFVVTARPK